MDIAQTADGGYIAGGYSSSGISGDKTEAAIGSSDYWVIKLNMTGDIEWQNTIQGSGHDEVAMIEEISEGNYIIGGSSYSAMGYDKLENSVGNDMWILKMGESCEAGEEICNALDDNCNGIPDDGVVETVEVSAGGPITFCQGGTVLLSAAYSGTSIQWKKNGSSIPGATSATYNVNKSGNYTAVTTSDCGTATSSAIHVTVNKNPAASIIAGGPTSFCTGGSVTLTETPVAGCSYQWYKGASSIAGATTTSYIATMAGNYKCRVTKTASGCFKNSNAITVTVPCKENGLNYEGSSINIYPNPNNGEFNVTGTLSGYISVEIVNAQGQIIYSEMIDGEGGLNESIILENIPAGIYLVRLQSEQTFRETKIVIQ